MNATLREISSSYIRSMSVKCLIMIIFLADYNSLPLLRLGSVSIQEINNKHDTTYLFTSTAIRLVVVFFTRV